MPKPSKAEKRKARFLARKAAEAVAASAAENIAAGEDEAGVTAAAAGLAEEENIAAVEAATTGAPNAGKNSAAADKNAADIDIGATPTSIKPAVATSSPVPNNSDGNDARPPKRQRATTNVADHPADAFLNWFFGLNVTMQQSMLNAIARDRRGKSMLSAALAATNTIPTLEYNNRVVDVNRPSNYRDVDSTPFYYYAPTKEMNAKKNGTHRSLYEPNKNNPQFNLQSAADQACLHYANRINNFVMGLQLSDEQRRSALWKAFSLNGMREMVASYGLSHSSLSTASFIMNNIQRFIQYSRSNTSRRGRASDAQRLAVNAIATGSMLTPVKPKNETQAGEQEDGGDSNSSDGKTVSKLLDNKARATVSARSILKVLGVPEGSHHILKKCGKFRTAAKEGLENAYDFLGPRKSWEKVKQDVWDRFRHEWLPNCQYISNVPNKSETVFLRSDNGTIVRGDDNEPVVVQKMLAKVPQTHIYQEMVKSTQEGGFDGARDANGEICISESAMRRRWPNYIKPMTNRFKSTCVCDKCGVPSEVHDSLNFKRYKLLKQLENDIKGMRPSARKTAKANELKKYKDEIVMDNGKLKYDRMSKLIDEIACPAIEIDGVALPRFECAVGDCTVCKDNYQPIEYEADCVETIKYNLYVGHTECSWHGDGSIEKRPNDTGQMQNFCTKCEVMSPEEMERWLGKKKRKATIKSSKYKSKYAEALQEFVKCDGTYHQQLRQYMLHRFHRTFLGTKVALKKIREYNENTPESIMIQSDYTEKYQPQPDGQFQSQYFDRNASLSAEGHAVTYYDVKKAERVLNFYAALSDEKRQDGGTTAENMSRMLADLFLERKEIVMKAVRLIIRISDGCSAQYRSGTVYYELLLLAIQWGCTIDSINQASGHGKCLIDSQLGLDKSLLDLFFNCLVANPEELIDGLKRVEAHDWDDNGLVSLAEVCHKILSDPDRTYGSSSNSRRANRKINEKRYLVRPPGKASNEGLKYICDPRCFQKGDGVRSNYHARADVELLSKDMRPNLIAMRRFPCFCKGCVDKMAEPVESRYKGPCNTCIYWQIFKKTGEEVGYNDWKIVTLVPKPNGYVEDDDLDRLEVAMKSIGERMSSQIRVGNYGAYVADDDRYDYYLFKCISEPEVAKEDTLFEIDGNSFSVKKGQWYCKGLWLDTVHGKQYVETHQRCYVRLQVVVDGDVQLSAQETVTHKGKQYDVKRLSDDDHSFLLKEAIARTTLDYTDYVYEDVCVEDEDDGSDMSDVECEE